eukprot:1154215-Pelagomonas_calceolata.AAC.5
MDSAAEVETKQQRCISVQGRGSRGGECNGGACQVWRYFRGVDNANEVHSQCHLCSRGVHNATLVHFRGVDSDNRDAYKAAKVQSKAWVVRQRSGRCNWGTSEGAGNTIEVRTMK